MRFNWLAIGDNIGLSQRKGSKALGSASDKFSSCSVLFGTFYYDYCSKFHY